jgi:hypothetical protein
MIGFVGKCVEIADDLGASRQEFMDMFDMHILAVFAGIPAREELFTREPQYLMREYGVKVDTHLTTSRDVASAPRFHSYDFGSDLPVLFFDHKVSDTTDLSIKRRLSEAGMDTDRSPVTRAFPKEMGEDAALEAEMFEMLEH